MRHSASRAFHFTNDSFQLVLCTIVQIVAGFVNGLAGTGTTIHNNICRRIVCNDSILIFLNGSDNIMNAFSAL